MAKKSTAQASWLQTTAIRVTRVHFLYVAVYILSTIIFDMWNLYAYEVVTQLWTAAGLLLVLNTVLWYLGRMKFSDEKIYAIMVILLVVADIAFAAYNVYWQRGLASKSVALFAVPIITAATLRSRTTLLATSSLCVAAYSMVAVRYFFLHYGESFRVELYGSVGFYSAMFFVLAGLLLIIIKPTKENL